MQISRPPSPDDPAPLSPLVVGALLRLIAAGLEPIHEAERHGPGRSIALLTATGWWLVVVTDGEGLPADLLIVRPASLLAARWIRGCQRNDWTAAEAARVITPLELLTSEQLHQLRDRLVAAPPVAPLREVPWWDVSNLDEAELAAS